MRCAALLLAVAAALLACSSLVDAAHGGDVSEFFDEATFRCTVHHGWSFVIIRSYCSFGGVDSNAPRTLAAAKAGGVAHRDVYHFPCRGVSAEKQITEDVDHVGKGNFGMMWFDIETNPSPGCHWSGDRNENCRFLHELIKAGHGHGLSMGVYASEYMWGSIMGDACHVAADNGVPLWYAHYDQWQSFSDFTPFGGWSKPNIKQYWDSVNMCGIGADANWYP